ncbi:MAG: hypothetical protein KJN64_04320 [Ignavibacteria bacterium]|nr:hypothetical protein [Ignavibacteria bacterium]MBT8382463.1 hypothetical protein [Ignavibacteria bacterium]MBT8390258.1 hypothetical protein [Ignavibacteria bacterium]NNJ52872.1 hypothetical protein [Ignavibacteriaceae bacterium]NNL20545.1 hypothetical protein [Ignavibacteriaceae bacterium]
MPQYSSSKKSGCYKKTFFGCAALFLIFFVIIILIIISIKLPEVDFSKTEKREYNIEVDSLTNENVINASFSWRFVDNSLRRRKFDLNLRLLEREVKVAMDYIEALAEMSYRDLGLQSRYPDPITEARIVWAEVYRRVFNNSLPQLKNVMQGFNKIFKEEKFGAKDKVYFVVTFVQNIPYERPGGVLDLFPPLGTLAYRYGDCDSKAILLYVILEKMSVDCAMLWSYKYKHAMLGVKFSGRGEFLTANGKKYYFLETTYPRWSIGELPPEFNNTRFWFIDEIDSNELQQELIDQNEIDKNETRRKVKPSPSIP